MRRLICDFIFEVADSGRETTVGSHVGVADKTETQFEVEGFVERLVLKNAGANDLAGNGGEDFVLAVLFNSACHIRAACFWHSSLRWVSTHVNCMDSEIYQYLSLVACLQYFRKHHW